ncbi:MAG: hypothetical protein AAGH76_11130 [Pseudomonadota bacterium]
MRHRFAMPVLYGLIMLAPVAHLAGWLPVQAIAAATQSSPAMKVFTSHNGYETFSPKFHLRWQERGRPRSLQLTPAVYSRIEGPYNRRNAFGAALSYAPVLSANAATEAMHASVIRYALCQPATVLDELGIDRTAIDGPVAVNIIPRRELDARWQLSFEVTCHD